jgi:hypothetical protein
MGTVDIAYVCAIAVLHYMFTTRSVKYMFDEKIETCQYRDNDGGQYSACLDRNSEIRARIDTRVFRVLIMIAVATLVASGLIHAGLIGSALSISSLMLILRSIVSEWSKLGELSRLLVLAAGLAIVMYGAHRYSQVGSFGLLLQ